MHGLDVHNFVHACEDALPDYAHEVEIASAVPIGFEYIGCFDDADGELQAAGRDAGDLEPDVDGEVELGSPDRVMDCATACQGYRYAALLLNNDCLCDNEYGSQEELFGSQCDADGSRQTGEVENCVSATGEWSSAAASVVR